MQIHKRSVVIMVVLAGAIPNVAKGDDLVSLTGDNAAIICGASVGSAGLDYMNIQYPVNPLGTLFNDSHLVYKG